MDELKLEYHAKAFRKVFVAHNQIMYTHYLFCLNLRLTQFLTFLEAFNTLFTLVLPHPWQIPSIPKRRLDGRVLHGPLFTLPYQGRLG